VEETVDIRDMPTETPPDAGDEEIDTQAVPPRVTIKVYRTLPTEEESPC
jgi:hypothetical protein